MDEATLAGIEQHIAEWNSTKLVLEDAPALVAEVRRLSAALDAVRALHERAEGPDGESLCAECGDGTGSEDWPCPTLNALDHPSWWGRDLGHRGPCRTVAAAPSGEQRKEDGQR